MRSESSSTEIDLSSSIQSWVVVAILLVLLGFSLGGRGLLGRRLARLRIRVGTGVLGRLGGSRVGVRRGLGRGRRGGPADQALVGDLRELAREAGDERVQARRQAGDRRGDHAD